MKSNFLKKTVSMALAVTMCSGIACSAGFLTKAAEPNGIDDNIVVAQSSEVQENLIRQTKNRFAVDGLNYQVINKTSVAVVWYDSRDISVNIPATVSYNKKSYKVTSIGDKAFEHCTSLQEINLPDSITSIGEYAFNFCTSLQEINLPNSIISIGNGAFSDCDSLQKINLPNSVTSISGFTFANCPSLQEINLPNSITSIGAYAFSGCHSLQEINLPNSITSIGECAFACCGLKSVYIPNSVTFIGEVAFMYCPHLAYFVVPERFKADIKNLQILSHCDNVEVVYYN